MTGAKTPAAATASSDHSSPTAGTGPGASGGAHHSGVGTGPRTAKACVNCSVKKRRCDGGQPECSVCSALGIPCSYNNNPLRRGPPKGFRSDPETSAKAKLIRKLETTVRDLVAQLGKEQAAREVYRVSLERGIDQGDMDHAKPEGSGVDADAGPSASEREADRAEGPRSPKRARTDGGPGGISGQQPQSFAYPQDTSYSRASQAQQPFLRTAAPPTYGYPPNPRNGQGSTPHAHQHPPQHPHLAHLAHEASMLHRAHSAGPQPLPYTVKTQEEDDDFLGVNERGDFMHRGSSSGIGLLNRTHTQIQQFTGGSGGSQYGSGHDPRSAQGMGSSPNHTSDRANPGVGPRVYLPPISTIQSGPISGATASPMGLAGTVPLPLAAPFGAGSLPASQQYHASGLSAPAAPSAHPGAWNSPAGYPPAPLYAHSARSSPAPYDDRASRAAAFSASQGRPLSTDGIRGRSPPGGILSATLESESSAAAALLNHRPHRRLQDEHRMSSLSPARHGGVSGSQGPQPRSPRRRWSGRSDDEQRAQVGEGSGRELAPSTLMGQESLPRLNLSQEEKNLLFKYYYSDFHPFWPVLFKPALDAIPMDQLPDRLDEVLLYAIWTMGSAVMPNATDSNAEASPQESRTTEDRDRGEEGSTSGPGPSTTGTLPSSSAERATLARLRSLAPQLYACAEAHLFASRLRPTVSTIQSLFLLSLYSHGCGELSRAWVYSGLACAMLMDLGLHRWPIHRIELLHESAERETRTRLIWCVYILDKVLSAEMGRPVILRATDCDAPFLSEVEADELEPWTGSVPNQLADGSGTGLTPAETTQYIHAPSCLNWGIRLFQIVEKILSSVHAFRRKAQLRHNANAHHILSEIDKELNRWKMALPDWLSLERLENTRKAGEAKEREAQMSRPRSKSPPRSRPLPSFFALHLWYFTSTLLLHRPFIPQDEGALLSEVLANESHRKCTEAANTICDLVEASSTPVDRLSTDLAYCIFTAAVLQLFNARLADEEIARAARRRLNLCRQWLKELSETWPAASAHKQLLDGFSIVGQGAVEDTEVQLGIEAAAVAVATDVEAAAAASGLGGGVAESVSVLGNGERNEPAAPSASAEDGLPAMSLDPTPPMVQLSASSSGPRPLEQHAGAQLRNPSSSTMTTASTVSTGPTASPSLLPMPGSGRLLMFNGTSPVSIPMPSITRSPFFSMNTGKALPSFANGAPGASFMLDGGGSALGTAPGPLTPQQRAQMEQYQAYMASFQSRYAHATGMDASAAGQAPVMQLGNVFGGAGVLGNAGVGTGAMPMSTVGTWMVPNTSMTSLNMGVNVGSVPGPDISQEPKMTTVQAVQQRQGSAGNTNAPVTANEIMTPMRMVNADVQAAQSQPQTQGPASGGDGSGPSTQVPAALDGIDVSSVPMTMPSIMADAPVGLWDIENFFWNERSAGAASANPTYNAGSLPDPAMDQSSLNRGALEGQPNPPIATGNPSAVSFDAAGRSTPSTMFGIPPLPPPTRSAASSNPGGTYAMSSNGTSGTGPAASFQQLYSQVHARKMSNNATGTGGGTHLGNAPAGVGPEGASNAGLGGPTDRLSMLAEVTAAGETGGATSSFAAGGPNPTAGSGAGGPSNTSAVSSSATSGNVARTNSNGNNGMGTPMLGVHPSRRMTPLIGSNTPSGAFGPSSSSNGQNGGSGAPSLGGTGNTPLFNIGMGLGMSATGSSSGGSGNGGGFGYASGSGTNGGANSIISLSPFGFSMTPDPVVWDALALLELPPSFAKV